MDLGTKNRKFDYFETLKNCMPEKDACTTIKTATVRIDAS